MVSIRLDGVGAAYGRETILQGITTPAFRGGEVVAVIGPNAAGKSTLFKRIAGLVRGPGTVHLEQAGATRQPIVFMPQDSSATAALTAYEAILLARKQDGGWSVAEADTARVDAVMAALGIEAIAFRPLAALSGGQRQLVNVAQALVRDPAVLLMDEPTSALDLQRQVALLSFVRDTAARHDMAVFIALHDLNQALRFADHAMVVDRGGLAACGPSPEVIAAPLLRAVYGVEARIERCSRGLPQVIVDGVAAAAAP